MARSVLGLPSDMFSSKPEGNRTETAARTTAICLAATRRLAGQCPKLIGIAVQPSGVLLPRSICCFIQDRYHNPRRLPRRNDRGQAQSRDIAAPARHCRDHKSLFDLVGRDLLCRPQMVRLQPGMGRPARFGHLDMRRVGGDRKLRRD